MESLIDVELHAQAERQCDAGGAVEPGDHLEHAGIDAGARIVVAHGLAAELAGVAGDLDREAAIAERVGGRVRGLAERDAGDVGLVDLGADLELA